MTGTLKVWTVERCYDYEGCALEQVYGSEAEANAYVASQKAGGTSANLEVKEWDVAVAPVPHEGCVTRMGATCAYLADGTKLTLRRKPYRGTERVWLENVPQAVLRAAAPSLLPGEETKR